MKAILFLISAIASAGFRPLGQVLLQLRMVWHLYRLMLLFRASLRSAVLWSLESAIQRYDCSKTAGPRYSSLFHQYEGHEVLQQAHKMHSYSPSSLRRSAFDWRYSLPYDFGQWSASQGLLKNEPLVRASHAGDKV